MSARTDRQPPAVDASMRLLREVMEQPLDPAYERAARSRAAGARPGRTVVVLTVVLAVLCGWIVARGVAELRRPEPGQATGRATHEREIQRRTAAADAAQRQIQDLRTQITKAQEEQLTSQGDAALAAQVQQLGLLTGELPVTGPGLEFSIADARPADPQGAAVDPRAASAEDGGQVLDRDLQIVVNGLWAAGAEAVSINGRRLTSLSAIRSAGQAILVDYRPLLPPYAVRAVGDPAGLQSGFAADMAGPYVRSLQDNYHIQAAIAEEHRLTVPGAGQLSLRYATVPRAGATGSATPGSTGSGAASPGVRSSSATSSGPSEVSP